MSAEDSGQAPGPGNDRPDETQLGLLHVVPNLEVGGAEMLVDRWVRNLDPARYRSSVLCLGHLGPLGEKLIDDGFEVTAVGAASGFKMSTLRAIAGHVRQNRIDIVHAHTYSPFFFSSYARMTRACRRLVFTEHGRLYPEPHRPKRKAINPLLCRAADRIVSISEATRQAMQRHDGIPAGKIQVIWNGVELPASDPDGPDPGEVKRSLGLEPDALVCGMASRLVALKDLPTAIQAFAEARQSVPRARLVIAGDGEERQALEARVAELGLTPYVRFLGMRGDLPHVYGAFDLFLLSSLTEGISVTLLETMARGIPSVVTAVGGNPEVVVHGETGFTVPAGDIQAMGESIKSLLEDVERRRTMGRTAAARAHAEFSLSKMFERYEDVYRGR